MELENGEKIAFGGVEGEQEREMELQMEALACGMHLRPRDDDRDVARPNQPFSGYRYMTPIEFSDDEPVTLWTIIRSFEADTGIHGVDHIGHAIGKSNPFESYDTYRCMISNRTTVALMKLRL